MKKKNLMSIFASMQARAVTSKVTTAGATENGGTPFTSVIRAVWSREIEFQALPVMRFQQFADTMTELGVEPGLTINMLTYDNLEVGGALKENVDMVTQALSGSVKQITVTEHGNAVSVSQKLLTASFDDLMARTSALLGRDYAVVVDVELRDTALSGTNVVYATKKDGTKIDSRGMLEDDCILKVSTIKDAIEILATNNAPKLAGNYWICFVHPHQSRTLRDDPAWINASNYGAPEQLFTGEIGRIDDTRFIETTMMCNGVAPAKDKYKAYKEGLAKGKTPEGGSVANKTNVYQACLFGESYYGIAFALPVELRDNGVEDFGRKVSLGWYSIFGVGKLHDDRGVVIETA